MSKIITLKKVCVLVACYFFLIPVMAQQPKGYIQNDQGEKCWYKQIKKPNNIYFYSEGVTSNTATLTFDDSKCMSDSGTGLGLDINKMVINYIITKTYSHNDADFQTRVTEMYKGSPLQVKGSCVQSKKYSAIGVTVDYLISNGSITGVVHGGTAFGCTN